MKIKEIKLPKRCAGFDVGPTRINNRLYFPTEPGQALRFVPETASGCRIEVEEGDWSGATVHISKGAGLVSFEGIDIVVQQAANTKGKAIHWGEASNTLLDDTLRLEGCSILALEPLPGRDHSGVWGVFTYGADLIIKDVLVDATTLAEHAFYPHGYGLHGLKFIRVDWLGSGSDNLKPTQRPRECAWSPEASILIRGCRLRNWHQPHGWQGGGGIVLQGAGCKEIRIEQTEIVCPSEPGKAKAIMIDDGLSYRHPDEARYYDQNGVPGGPGAANGLVFIDEVGIGNGVGPTQWGNVIKTQTTYEPWPVAHPIVEGIQIKNSGIYGERLFVSLHGVPDTHAVIKGCNRNYHATMAENHGWSTQHEAVVQANGLPVSAGYYGF